MSRDFLKISSLFRRGVSRIHSPLRDRYSESNLVFGSFVTADEVYKREKTLAFLEDYAQRERQQAREAMAKLPPAEHIYVTVIVRIDLSVLFFELNAEYQARQGVWSLPCNQYPRNRIPVECAQEVVSEHTSLTVQASKLVHICEFHIVEEGRTDVYRSHQYFLVDLKSDDDVLPDFPLPAGARSRRLFAPDVLPELHRATDNKALTLIS